MLVSDFIERALYAPDNGFYETGGRAGRRGSSFITSPEVGPLFGAVILAAAQSWWHEAGEPDEWIVVDAGAGPGTLAKSVLAALDDEPDQEPHAFRAALRYVCVERSSAQRQLHLERVESMAELPDEADVVIANELLDNLPFDILERTRDGWELVHVAPDGTTKPDTGGSRIPLATSATNWILDARRRLRPGGRLLCFDYADTTAAMAQRPWTDWVRAFAGHEQISDVFADPGTRDVTLVVPWDQLPEATSVTTQAEWLRIHGIDSLVDAGRVYWNEHAARPDVRALRMRSRINEAGALLDPDSLGGFWVGEWKAAGG